MNRQILIMVGDKSLNAELNDSVTADAIWEALPFEGSANVWGDEVYFDIPVKVGRADDAREEMAVGELAYWPAGSAFCIFYGRTPVSIADEPRAYSPVNVFGQVLGDAASLRGTTQNTTVRVIRQIIAG